MMTTYASAYTHVLPDDHRDALRAGAEMVVDYVFEDLQSVEEGKRPEWLRLSAYLPDAYAHRYDVMFAQRFLVAAVSVGLKLAQDEPAILSSVAEELACNAIIQEAEVWLDLHDKKADFDEFRHDIDQDFDFELLLSPEFDGVEHTGIIAAVGMANLAFKDWFKTFDNAPRAPLRHGLEQQEEV